MFSRSGSDKNSSNNNGNPPPVENRFTLPFLKKLHQQLVENKHVTTDNEAIVVEILRIIAEMVVYGDSKSEMLFDFFCEKNMLSLFLELMWTEGGCPQTVHIQILQTLSILVNSVKNDTSLYYLLSNNYINEIIVYPHDFDLDESLRDQFVSFMKSISLRLNCQTVQFFFIEDTGSFPLLSRAIEMLQFKEPMVRIASQTTILNIFRIDDERSRGYALQDDILTKFISGVTSILESQYQHIRKISLAQMNLVAANPVAVDQTALNRFEYQISDLLLNNEDWCCYIDDILALGIPKLNRAVVMHIIAHFFHPVLVSPLLDVPGWKASENFRISHLNSSLSTPVKNSLFDGESSAEENPEESSHEKLDEADGNGTPTSAKKIDRISNKLAHGIAIASADSFTNIAETKPDDAAAAAAEVEEISLNSRNESDASSPKKKSNKSSKPWLKRSTSRLLILEDSNNDRDFVQEDQAKYVPFSESSEETCLTLVLSLMILSQMIRTISNKSFHRAVIVALFHPLCRHSRKSWIDFLFSLSYENKSVDRNISHNHITTSSDSIVEHDDFFIATSEPIDFDSGDIVSLPSKLEFNGYREAFMQLFDVGQERLTLLASFLLHSIFNREFDSLLTKNGYDRLFSAQVSFTSIVSIHSMAVDTNVLPSSTPQSCEKALVLNQSKLVDDVENDIDGFSDKFQIFSEEWIQCFPNANLALSNSSFNHDLRYCSSEASSELSMIGDRSIRTDSDILSVHKLIALNACVDIKKSPVWIREHVSEGIDQSLAEKKIVSILQDYIGEFRNHLIHLETQLHSDSFGDGMLTRILFDPLSYPLTTLQVVMHTIFTQSRILFLASSCTDSDSNETFSEDAAEESAETAPSIEMKNDSSRSNNTSGQHTPNSTSLLIDIKDLISMQSSYCNLIRNAGRDIAQRLLTKINGPMADAMINFVQEELHRVHGRKWSELHGKILMDPMLLLPMSPNLSSKLGLEHSVPISQMEVIRREIQIFIMIRALYTNLRRMLTLMSDESLESSTRVIPKLDDICVELMDSLWQQYLDKSIVASENLVGQYFSMKGKKYLDAYLIPNKVAVHSDPSTPSSTSSSSSLLSSLSFGYLGKKSPTPTPTLTSTPTSAQTSPNPAGKSPLSTASTSPYTPTTSQVGINGSGKIGKSRCGEVLFVQDRHVMLVVKPEEKVYRENGDNKVRFKILVAAPLMHTDATIDVTDRTHLKILVRSWDPVLNMERLGSDLENVESPTSASASSSNSSFHHSHSLLLPRIQSSLWEINLGLGVDKAASLSAHHIEGRRTHIRSEKIKYLQALFTSWASEEMIE